MAVVTGQSPSGWQKLHRVCLLFQGARGGRTSHFRENRGSLLHGFWLIFERKWVAVVMLVLTARLSGFPQVTKILAADFEFKFILLGGPTLVGERKGRQSVWGAVGEVSECALQWFMLYRRAKGLRVRQVRLNPTLSYDTLM